MSKYRTVEQGEYVASIARNEGFLDWRKLYQHPENADLRRKRPDPNVLFPGDVIFIPDKQEKTEQRATAREHVFQVPSPFLEIRLFLHEQQEGQAMENVEYVLTVDGTEHRGKTGSDGLVIQKVPLGSVEATLSVPAMRLTWKLQVGHMDPHHQVTEPEHIVSGVQARLANLGYYFGNIDGNLDEATTSAIRQFQRHVLERDDADGALDEATGDALLKRHRC